MMKGIELLTEQVLGIISRNFMYNRFYTFINIGGLAAGLTCALLILLFIRDELSYDKHHKKNDRIYRLESDFTVSGRNQKVAKTPYAIGPMFKKLYPEVEDFVRFGKIEGMAVRGGESEFFENNLFYADSSVFNIFTHNFIYGTAHDALSRPGSIVLTLDMSQRYFGNEDPIGRKINLGNGNRCNVTAVIENLPSNSHMKFDGLVSMTTYARQIGDSIFHELETRHTWAIRIFTFILLAENTSIQGVHEKFPQYYDEHMAELGRRFNGTYGLMSTKLTDLHLYTNLEWDLATGDISTVYLFAAIGILILIIAAINYMNLATARSAGKAKEVGIRKVMGASRRNLIQLFISESVILSLMALVIALSATDLLMPWFNRLTDKSLVLLESITDPVLYIGIIISILVGLLAGTYPGLYLSSFKPVNVLYGRIFKGRGKGIARKVLMFFQFFISIGLIIATTIVFEQMRHIRTKNLGYDQDNLMIVPQLDTAALASYPVFREKCLHIAGVRQVSSAMFVTGLDGAMDIMLVEDKGQRSQQLISLNYVTDHFVDLMGMRILAGRDFIPNNKTDFRSHVLINETAVRKLGWEDNPLGREIAESAASDKPYKVVGVIRDFHYAPLNEEIGPMVFFLRDKGQSQIHIKLEGRNISKTIRQIEMLWKEVYPENPFTYSFLDAGLRNTYMHEDKLLKLMGVFTMFSILIALLGLFGLSSYITEKYTREIGIRKVFGASPFTIVIHLSKQYIYLIILACIISMPICWYIMENWLTGFAYRTEINPWWFALTGTTVIIVALCTVIFQSLRAASRNPVEALRYE